MAASSSGVRSEITATGRAEGADKAKEALEKRRCSGTFGAFHFVSVGIDTSLLFVVAVVITVVVVVVVVVVVAVIIVVVIFVVTSSCVVGRSFTCTAAVVLSCTRSCIAVVR